MGLRTLEGEGVGKGLGGKPCRLSDSVSPQVGHDVCHNADTEGPEEHLQDKDEDQHQSHDQGHDYLDPSWELGHVGWTWHAVGLADRGGKAGVGGEVGGDCLSVVSLVKEVSHEEGEDEEGDSHEGEAEDALGPEGEGVILPHHGATHTGHNRTQPA